MPNNNQGGNKGGDGNKKKVKKTKTYKKAVRNARLENRPYLRSIRRERKRGLNEFADLKQGVNQAYGGFNELMAPLAGQYQTQTADIASGLTQNLTGLVDMLGGANAAPGIGLGTGLPQAEVGGAGGVFGGFAAGAMGDLASQAQRNLSHQTSAVREGGLAQRTALSNIVQDKRDFLQDMRDRRLDVKSFMPAMISQEMDELRREALERKLALSQLRESEAYRKFLIDMIGGQL